MGGMTAVDELERLLAGSSPPPDDDFWYQPAAPPLSSGVSVTVSNALQVEAVQACVRVLSESLASLPLIIYRRMPDDSKERARQHPLYEVLHDRPNPWQTSFEFREMQMAHLCLRGNAYAQIIAGPRGAVDQLIPLNPDRMRIEQYPDYSLRYAYSGPDGKQYTFLQGEIFHIRNFSMDGLTGLTPIAMANEGIGEAIAAAQTSASLFKNKLLHGGILQHPGQLTDRAHANLKRSYAEQYAGVTNAHKPMILEEGMSWQQMTMTADDAQFLETRKYKRSDICGIFRVPPHMIGDLERATFSNIEHQDTAFEKHTLRPWCERWEAAILRDLITAPQLYFAEFLIMGLLRADVATRASYFTSAITTGWLTRNEARALENMNPLEGLDDPLMPLNLKIVGEEEEGPAPRTPQPQLPPGENELEQEEEEADGEAESLGDNAALQIMIDDAAVRLAAAEISALEKRAKHAAKDRDTFNAWVDKFYDGHREYVAKTLAPVAKLVQALGGGASDLDYAFVVCVEAPRLHLKEHDPLATLEQWRGMKGRPLEIADALMGGLKHGD